MELSTTHVTILFVKFMAISYVQLLLLLLASLFFLPALSTIGFEYCNKNGYNFGNFTRVEVSPDTQYILIYGSTSNTNQTLLDGVLDLSIEIDKFMFPVIRNNDLRWVVDAWPLEPGKDFVLRVWREKYLRFYEKYMGVLTLYGKYEDSAKLKELMCINFKIPPPTPST